MKIKINMFNVCFGHVMPNCNWEPAHRLSSSLPEELYRCRRRRLRRRGRRSSITDNNSNDSKPASAEQLGSQTNASDHETPQMASRIKRNGIIKTHAMQHHQIYT